MILLTLLGFGVAAWALVTWALCSTGATADRVDRLHERVRELERSEWRRDLEVNRLRFDAATKSLGPDGELGVLLELDEARR